MPVYYGLRKVVLRYTGVFDMQGLFQLMVQWFKARRYWFQEKTYKHRPGDEFGREEEIYWNAQRQIDNYYQWDIDIYFHLWHLRNVEAVNKEGKKVKMQYAKMEIWFDGGVTLDYQARWERTKFHVWLRDVYHKYILRPDNIIGSIHWDELYYRMYKLHDLVKDYLDMHSKDYIYRPYLGDNV